MTAIEEQERNEQKDSTICKNCHWDVVNHAVDGKCLFEASSFSPMKYKDLIDFTLAGWKDEHTHQTTQGPTKPYGV